MQTYSPVPHARLPHTHRHRHVLASTVDAFGTAHWLLADRVPEAGIDVPPYDALFVSVHEDGATEVTELSAIRARWPHVGRLPDGGFVVTSSRERRHEDGTQVQVFDALGRESWTFSVGDAVEHLLVDAAGDLWVGHFDENPLGIRRWSATGQLRWSAEDIPGAGWIMDCYALNVSRSVVWACPYTDFPLLEIRPDREMRVRSNGVRGAKAVAVHGERVAFLGGYRNDRDRIAFAELTETSVEPTDAGLLSLPDGRRRVVARGSRIYLQHEPFTEWAVFDLSG
ncbi:hypothetical protein GTW71_34195 [Streptomyces sp. SID6041]|nr:hypothetical protein [Streptomyces sp. SID6041]